MLKKKLVAYRVTIGLLNKSSIAGTFIIVAFIHTYLIYCIVEWKKCLCVCVCVCVCERERERQTESVISRAKSCHLPVLGSQKLKPVSI
jgi:hypothetical protein